MESEGKGIEERKGTKRRGTGRDKRKEVKRGRERNREPTCGRILQRKPEGKD